MQTTYMKTQSFLVTGFLVACLFCFAGTLQSHAAIAYGIPAGTAGTQAYNGALGNDFDVSSPDGIVVTRLGVFDDGSNGLNSTITVGIFDRTTATLVGSSITFSGDDGSLEDATRFADLTSPISLPAGFQGSIVAQGYNGSEQNGNAGTGSTVGTTDDGDGAITFVGGSRFGPGGVFAYPTSVDGGPVNRYHAGNFDFTVISEDSDNDGLPDLYVANYGANRFYHNAGRGRFTDVTATSAVGDSSWGAHAAFSDVDRDGDLDLYVANYMDFDPGDNRRCFRGEAREYCGPNTYAGKSGVLYRNDGDLRFSDITEEAGLSTERGKQLAAVFGDLDEDGDEDLFIANDKNPNFLFVNDGKGHFVESGAIAGVAYNEEGVAESAMGADLGYIGSAFIATDEANADERYKQSIVDGSANDIIYSNLFTGVHGNYLRNSIEAAGLDPENLPESDPSKMDFGDGSSKAWKDIWGSGQGIGAVKKIGPAADLIARLKQEYSAARQRMEALPWK